MSLLHQKSERIRSRLCATTPPGISLAVSFFFFGLVRPTNSAAHLINEAQRKVPSWTDKARAHASTARS